MIKNSTVTHPRSGARTARSLKIESLFGKVVKDGDYNAFRELFSRYYCGFCSYAMRVVKIRETAEEVVSDVFVKLWKNKANIEIHTSFEAYMYRAIRNQALDYLKLRTHRHTEKDSLDTLDWHSAHADNVTPIDEYAFNEFFAEVERCVNSLPRQCQAIFRMSREEGLRYREIAEKLNISIKTVETQMGRALKVLRERIPQDRLVA